MSYTTIAPLPPQNERDDLASSELASLRELWLEKKRRFENTGEYGVFIKRMRLEWAIETGIIERLYHWDRGMTETLIEQGIDAALISHRDRIKRDKAENIAKMIHDQEAVVEGLFALIKNERPVTEHFIRTMHQQFTAHQDFSDAVTPQGAPMQVTLLKGAYKTQPNNPTRSNGTVHEYCPPQQVTDEMQRLVELYHEYEEADVAPEILSAWLHHRFVQIHPFQDGNGRVARALATLIFLRAGLFPLVIRDSDRKEYISSLEEADGGDLSRLVRLFSARERDSVLSALEIRQETWQPAHVIIKNAAGILRKRTDAKRKQIKSVYRVAAKLQETIERRLSEVKADLVEQLRLARAPRLSADYNAGISSARSEAENSHYYRPQIVEMAKEHGYFANTMEYKSWSRLAIFTEAAFEVIFSIHGYGYQDNGVMAVSGFTFERAPSKESEHSAPTAPKSAHPDIFRFNHRESEADILRRFNEWLEQAVTIALAEWQKTLG